MKKNNTQNNIYLKCKKKIFVKRIEGKGPEERHICPIHVYFIDGKINAFIDFAARYSNNYMVF